MKQRTLFKDNCQCPIFFFSFFFKISSPFAPCFGVNQVVYEEISEQINKPLQFEETVFSMTVKRRERINWRINDLIFLGTPASLKCS